MLEIERKILGIRKRELIIRIEKLKPKPQKLFEGLICVKYFDFSDQRIRKKRDLLRVREFVPKEGAGYVECVYKIYKYVKHGCKYFDEVEFRLPDGGSFEAISKLLKCLGLKQTLYYEKRRTLYAYGKVKFEIDEHPKIPAFVEIEGESPTHIEKAIELLNVQHYEQTSETISELLRRKYPKIKLNGLKF